MSQKFLNPVEVNGQVSAEYIDLSTSTSHSVNAGEIAWNSIDGTFDIGLLNGVTLQAGQEMHFYGKATEAISNGNAVMFAGVQGDHILIAKADAVTINTNPEYFMGVATQDFSTNDFGYVTAFGNVRGIDTSTYSLGDILYYDSTSATDGLLTPIIPLAPKAKIIVAAVVKVHATQGILAVRPHTMPRLKDIQDINIDTASAGEILQLQSDGVWENKTLSEAGIQPTLTNPITGTGTTNYLPKFTGATSLGNSQIFDNGTNVGIGTISPSTKLDLVGSDPGIRQSVERTSGGVAFSMFNLNAKNTTSGLSTSFGSIGVYGNLNVGPTPPSVGYIYMGADSTTAYNDNTFRLYPGKIANFQGNVGIGTTSPTQKLDVTGNIKISNNNSLMFRNAANNADISIIQLTNTNQLNLGTTSSSIPSVIALHTNSSERMRIDANGNVGIGTTSPSTNLHVLGNSFSVNPSARITHNPGSSPEFIELSAGAFDGGGIVSVGSTSSMIFKRGSNESMRINGSGNVGIGTSSPTTKLHVIGDVYTSTGYIAAGNSYMNSIGNTSTNNNANLSLTTSGVRTSRNIADSNTVFAVINQNASSTGPIQTWNNSGGELMRVAQNGNVGIGNSSPSAKLHVEGSFVSNSPTANFLVDSTNMITASVTSTTHGTGAGFELIDNSAAFGFNPFGDFRGVRADYDNGVWFVNESGGKLGLQPVDNNLWSEGNIIQKAESPLDTINPVAWIKIYNNDDSSFYFMPVYQ